MDIFAKQTRNIIWFNNKCEVCGVWYMMSEWLFVELREYGWQLNDSFWIWGKEQ